MSTLDVTRPASTRVSLARLAGQVVARNRGVSATQGRGRWLTSDRERTIPGVVVGQTGSGRLDVDLHLVAEWPPQPLQALGTQLRRELTEAARNRGIGDRLGRIEVSIHDLRGPGEHEGGER